MSKFFDKKAQEMDQHPIAREMALAFYNTMSAHVALSDEYYVLDYGCGSGLIGMYLYPYVKSMTMMDSSAGMLAVLEDKVRRNNIKNMKIIKSDLKTSDLAQESFDLIYINNVLHHIEDVESFLGLIRQKIKPGGHLCIRDFDKEDGTFHPDNTDVKHFGFDDAEICKYIKKSGLDIIKKEKYYTAKKPDSTGKMKEYPLFMATSINA